MKTQSTRWLLAASISAAALFAAAGALRAADVPVTLNYNFNGIAHTGEGGGVVNADAASGYRAISDRGLRVRGGASELGTNPIVGSTGLPYTIVTTAGPLDLVHLGNRNLLAPYDGTTIDGDNRGIIPTWETLDHQSPQMTSGLSIPMFANSSIGLLYQVSNGGGNFQCQLGFSDGSTATATLSANDWFGAVNPPAPVVFGGVASQTRLGGTTFAAVRNYDAGDDAPASDNLNVTEGIITRAKLLSDLGVDVAGKTLTSVTFQNALYTGANTGKAYAIFAVTTRGSAVFPPSGIAAVTPAPVIAGQPTVFSIAITLGSGSPNNLVGNVTFTPAAAIGAPIVLNDSGADGDAVAGDGTYSGTIAPPSSTTSGNYGGTFAASDAQGRNLSQPFTYAVQGIPPATDIGTLTGSGGTFSGAIAAGGELKWYKFTVASDIAPGGTTYLDIDTEGSALTATNDTELTLYRADGTLVVNDDDDGSALLSQLSFGATAPARPIIVATGTAGNGRDGTLTAGTYYLAVSSYNITPNATPFGYTTTGQYSGPFQVNFRLGTIPTGGMPTAFTDLGARGQGSMVSQTGTVPAGGVLWYRFTLASPVTDDFRQFIDIDTEGSALVNPAVALFRDDGSGTLVVSDNDDGSNLQAQLSIGRGTRAAVGNGLAYNGRDGTTLAAGTYFLAIADGSAGFGNNFVVGFQNSNTGSATLNLRIGTEAPPAYTIVAGPITNPANQHRYSLISSGLRFLDAEAIGVSLGGHLASIQDADENEFVRASVLGFDGVFNRRGWIGFTDRVSEGNFEWTDGSPISFTAFASGEPNNAGGVENYVEMLGSNGFWNDITNVGAAGGDFAVIEVVPASRCQPADIADDQGTPLPTALPNNGVNEGDYNAFFNNFFTNQSIGSPADIAYDNGDPLPPFGPAGGVNNGVNEGDYNAFFNNFFNGCPG
ncbi:hypothetical protein BH11PLA1_BH11PLA1_02140 [soil metagenome]